MPPSAPERFPFGCPGGEVQVSPLPFDNGRVGRSLAPFHSYAGASHCWPDPSRFNWMARIHLVRHGRPLPEPPHPRPTSLVWDCLREGWMGCRAAFLFCSAPPQPRPAGSYGAEPPSSPAVPKLRRGLAAQVTTRVALDDVGWLHLWTAAGFSRAYPPRCPTSEVQEWVASGRCPYVQPCATDGPRDRPHGGGGTDGPRDRPDPRERTPIRS